jgi:ABC-type Mn2+/Zn2+ transport system ATPase subunit
MSCARLDGITVRYDTGPTVLQVDHLELVGGTTTALIGPNGSGKSTLLQVIAGLLPPRTGRVSFAGQRPARRAVAMVFQSSHVDAGLPLTVAEVVRMGRYPHRGLLGRFRAEDRESIAEAMDRVEVTDLARRQLIELSGGQRQRVLTARALAQQAEVLLLDEAHTGLDAASEVLIARAVEDERERGAIVVAATHDLAVAARADQVVLLAGRPVACGPAAEVLVPARLADAYGPGVIAPLG